MRRDEVIALLQEHRAEIDAFGVKSLALFGSVARDEARPDSDVDVLVEFEGATTFDAYMGLLMYLETLLGSTVDLATPKMLKPRIVSSVERDVLRVA